MFRTAAVALLLVLASPALAKGKGKDKDLSIEMCGLASFDAVFAKVDAIDQRLTKAKKALGDAKRDINTALALEQGTSLQDALAALKARAAGQLTVTPAGSGLRIEARDGAPADVAEAIGAVNRLAGSLSTTIAELQGLPNEAAGLVAAASALPKQLKDEAKAVGMKPTEIPKILKVVKQDVEVAAGLPDKATAVVQRAVDVLATIGSLAR